MQANLPAGTKPGLAYVLLWFPLASETFIFNEVELLRKSGMDIRVYAMYGNSRKGLSKQMREYGGSVSRFGMRAILPICKSLAGWIWREPRLSFALARRGLFRKMRNLEAQAENSWCFLAGFLLADQIRSAGIGHIHSAWANGPATAAWVASRLCGASFSFTGRAGDIYPEDGLLAEKARDALFIRTNNAANVDWLTKFCPPGQEGKVHLIYNGLTLATQGRAGSRPEGLPWRILAVGRFARTKGFPELLTALARLKRENFPVRLTLVGDGAWKRRLLGMRRNLRLEEDVDMPGFVPNDQISHYMESHDLLVVPSVIHGNGDRDGIPNVIMEACMSGLPVVATDVCGIPEVIRDGETGRLTRQRDPAALAQAIREMLENPEQARAMAKKAASRVREMFDSDRNVAALQKIYLDALERVHA